MACLCLFGGGSASGSPVPNAAMGLSTDVPTETVTATVTATILTTVPIYTPVPVTETLTTTAVVTSTALTTVAVSVPNTGPRLPAARTPTIRMTYSPPTATVTQSVPNSQSPHKGSAVVVTETRPGPTTMITAAHPVVTSSIARAPSVGRLRLAAGTAGIAVTSAAGLGFLLLRRRGRYGL